MGVDYGLQPSWSRCDPYGDIYAQVAERQRVDAVSKVEQHQEAKAFQVCLDLYSTANPTSFDEALMSAVLDFFSDKSGLWQARFYSYVMESDCLDYIQINLLMEAANG